MNETMNETTKETITISLTTYELINEYVDLLDEISDRYVFDDYMNNTEIAHIELARWSAAHKIKEAIDGDASSLVESIALSKNSLDMLKCLDH